MTERICHPLVAVPLTTGEVDRKAAVEAATRVEREAAVRLIETARSMAAESEPPPANGQGATPWKDAIRRAQTRQHRRAAK